MYYYLSKETRSCRDWNQRWTLKLANSKERGIPCIIYFIYRLYMFCKHVAKICLNDIETTWSDLIRITFQRHVTNSKWYNYCTYDINWFFQNLCKIILQKLKKMHFKNKATNNVLHLHLWECWLAWWSSAGPQSSGQGHQHRLCRNYHGNCRHLRIRRLINE